VINSINTHWFIASGGLGSVGCFLQARQLPANMEGVLVKTISQLVDLFLNRNAGTPSVHFYFFLNASENPEASIPAGRANIPIPSMEIKAVSVLPKPVMGYISPYPTVVSVATLHHMVSGMLENLPGWASCSAKYITQEATIISENVNTKLIMSSSFFDERTLLITLDAFV
jgi:hypothetical protein